MTVRKAISDDFYTISRMLKDFDKFYSKGMEFYPDEDEASLKINDFINNHVVLVSVSGGIVTGVIGGYKHPHPFNSRLNCLTMLFWWVDEKYRSGRAGYLLMKEFMKYKCNVVTLTLGEKCAVKSDTMKKLGFNVIERSFARWE